MTNDIDAQDARIALLAEHLGAICKMFGYAAGMVLSQDGSEVIGYLVGQASWVESQANAGGWSPKLRVLPPVLDND